MSSIAFATVLCLSVLFTGCGKAADGSTGQENSGTKDEAFKTGGNGISEEGSKAADAETPGEDTSAPETPAEDTSNAETAAENTADTEGFVEIWDYNNSLVAKVPSKPLESWTSDYEPYYDEEGGYSCYSYHDEKNNKYYYEFFPASNTWELVIYWPDGASYGWYRHGSSHVESETWYPSDGRE